MANLFLVNPLPSSRPTFSLGLAVLKTAALKAGHKAEVIQPDWRVRDAVSPVYIAMEVAEALGPHLQERGEGQDVLGISVLSDTLPQARLIAQWAHQGKLGSFTGAHFKPVVVAGGHLPTLMAEELLRDIPEFDIALKGEAEESLPLLLEALDRAAGDFSHIPGAVWRKGSEILQGKAPCAVDLKRAPLPDESYLETCLKRYARPKPPAVPLDVQRGCPGACVFCSVAVFWHESGAPQQVRYRSPEVVIDHMAGWLRRGYEHFFLYSDCVLADPSFLEELVTGLEQQNLRVFLSLSARPQDVLKAEGALRRAASSNNVVLERIEIGFEADSEAALRLLRKGTTPEVNAKVLSLLRDLRRQSSDPIVVDYDFILLSHPDITVSDLEANIRFAAKYIPDDQEFAPVAVPYPKTPLWRRLKEQGLKPDPERGYVIPYRFSDPVVQRFFERMASLSRTELLARLRKLVSRSDLRKALIEGSW